MKQFFIFLFSPLILISQNLSGITGVRDYSYNNLDAYKNDVKHYSEIVLAEIPEDSMIEEKLNLVYKSDPRDLKMDYFGPKTKEELPALMFIHGGGWRTGDKSQHIPMARALAKRGIRVFLIEYRLSTEALYPAAMFDAHSALNYLFEHSREFNIKRNHITVGGFSAGGQMSALLGSTWDEEIYGKTKKENKIYSVIDLDGILAYIHPESGEGDDSKKLSAATQYFGYNKKERPDLWNEASALFHVSKDDPPVLFINSGVDRMHAGREDFRRKMDDFQIKTEVTSFEGSPHSFVLYEPYFSKVIDLIEENIKTDQNTLIVDKKGEIKTIQEAINLAKPGNEIFIKNGEYNEKVFIDSLKHDLFIVGESREGVILINSIARDIWRCSNPDDFGAAVLNIKGHDLSFRNLTIINNYGILAEGDRIIPCNNASGKTVVSTVQNYALPREAGEKEGEKIVRKDGHQFAVRAMPGGIKLAFVNCSFISGGGDTVSPWDVENGKYYFNSCSFEGGVDLYCPRGNAYAINCEFICHNMSAAMWHDGSGNEGDKNVIIQSKFRGDEGYKLGRYHREAQIYLIDCEYDENMADAEIYQAGERKLSWGHRIYYFGSKKSGKQFKWLENNIELDRKDLNFNWVFEGNWQLKL
ncbi:MAG: hypothetical protein RIR51_129 [Bacteroidota bacterium]|jgi:pectinesterase